MIKDKQIMQKENVVQAVVVADDFGDNFLPISDDTPLVSSKLHKMNRMMQHLMTVFLILGPVSSSQQVSA